MDWTRRGFLAGCVGLPLLRICPVLGRPYPGLIYRDYSACLPDFLTGVAEAAYQGRNRRLDQLTTAESITQYQEWARDTFWNLTGGRLERTPLNQRSLGSFDRPGYRVEKIVYDSRPDFPVPANLYLPASGKPPYPGVLFQMGHSLNGKAAATYQRCCQGLAQLGFVVLGFDPMGQGERAYYPREDGYMTRLDSADEEHSRPGRQMLLVGDTSTRLQLWDAVRSLDVLAAHPLVDPDRLASTGQSGGATLTMLLAAVDDRLKVAAVSSGNTENVACANFNPPGSTDDAEQNILNSGPERFDRWDLLYPFAPKPLLVLVSDRDWFGTYSSRYLSSGWEEYQKLEKIYQVMGKSDQLQWGDGPFPHNLAYDVRLEVYRWMLRWLKGDQQAAAQLKEEPPTRLEDDRTLWITRSGNVQELGSETPFSLNLKKAEAIRRPGGIGDLPALLALEKAPEQAREFARLGSRPSGRIMLEAVEVPSAPSVWVPAWMFLPEQRGEKVVVIVEPGGRSSRWKEGELYQSLADSGIPVCAPDIRWIGDLRPRFSEGARNHASWHQDEEAWSWGSLILGRPLLGQRVDDLLAVISAVGRHPETRGLKVVLAARGELTVPALCAAALSPEVESVLLDSGLGSFESVVETEDYHQPFANFVTGFLTQTDLPEIAGSIAPRRLTLAGTVDGAGRRLSAGEVRELYGSGPELTISEDPAWTLEAIKAL